MAMTNRNPDLPTFSEAGMVAIHHVGLSIYKKNKILMSEREIRLGHSYLVQVSQENIRIIFV